MLIKRKYFGTDGIRGRTGVEPITADFTLKLGWAMGQVLAQDGHGLVLIGKDTRVSGYMLSAAMEAGLIAAGLDVYLLGPMPTPGVAYLTRSFGAQAGVMVSASHNPYYDNGIKFFSAEGRKLPDPIESKIEQLISTPMKTVEPTEIGKAQQIVDAAGRYIEFCKHSFNKGLDLKGIKLVVDCANGAGYHIAPHVFTELGADVIAINHQPDGFNINHKCGSTNPESLQKAVLEHQAEIGIALDGDGDRCILVDHRGEVVDGDEILYVIANGRHRRQQLAGGIVGTLMTNMGLETALNQQNIPFVRAQVGDRYVMELLQEKGWRLGGETCGHIICLDQTTTGDGIIATLQVLAEVILSNKSLNELKSGLKKYHQVIKNVKVADPKTLVQSSKIQHVCQQLQKDLTNKGRVVLRPSGTEPVIRIMVEAQDKGLVETVVDEISSVVVEAAKVE